MLLAKGINWRKSASLQVNALTLESCITGRAEVTLPRPPRAGPKRAERSFFFRWPAADEVGRLFVGGTVQTCNRLRYTRALSESPRKVAL
jgi:hypothetical protein